MKLIYAEMVLAMLEAFKDEKYGNPHFMNGIATVMELIEDMPEAVVRCKDCRYLKTGENESESWSICARMIVYPYVDVGPNDYCSHGERREGGVDR